MAEKLTKDEMRFLFLIMDHVSDYAGGDDRLDHGLNRLKELREASQETKNQVYQLTGKLWRLSR